MLTAKDLVTNYNVSRTHQEGKYICFVLKNGVTVKVNPNESLKDKTEENNNA